MDGAPSPACGTQVPTPLASGSTQSSHAVEAILASQTSPAAQVQQSALPSAERSASGSKYNKDSHQTDTRNDLRKMASTNQRPDQKHGKKVAPRLSSNPESEARGLVSTPEPRAPTPQVKTCSGFRAPFKEEIRAAFKEEAKQGLWPSTESKERLLSLGLTAAQITAWFGNARAAEKREHSRHLVLTARASSEKPKQDSLRDNSQRHAPGSSVLSSDRTVDDPDHVPMVTSTESRSAESKGGPNAKDGKKRKRDSYLSSATNTRDDSDYIALMTSRATQVAEADLAPNMETARPGHVFGQAGARDSSDGPEHIPETVSEEGHAADSHQAASSSAGPSGKKVASPEHVWRNTGSRDPSHPLLLVAPPVPASTEVDLSMKIQELDARASEIRQKRLGRSGEWTTHTEDVAESDEYLRVLERLRAGAQKGRDDSMRLAEAIAAELSSFDDEVEKLEQEKASLLRASQIGASA